MMVVGTSGVCGPVCGPVRACFSGICTCCWRPEPRLAPSSLYLASDTPHLHCIWPPARAVTSNPCCSHSALRGSPCSHGKQNVRASFLSTCCMEKEQGSWQMLDGYRRKSCDPLAGCLTSQGHLHCKGNSHPLAGAATPLRNAFPA